MSPRAECRKPWCHRPARSERSGICQTHYERERNGSPPRFPSTPLIEYAAKRGVPLEDIGNELTLERADALSIDLLGAHPFEIWGDYWFTA